MVEIKTGNRAQPDFHQKCWAENRVSQATAFQVLLDGSFSISKRKVTVDMLRKRDINKRRNSGSVGGLDKIGLPGAIDTLDAVTFLARNHHRCRRDNRLDSPTSVAKRTGILEIAVHEFDSATRETRQSVRVRRRTHQGANRSSRVTKLTADLAA